MNLPEKVELIEVCPRDGFQNVHDIIPFDAKVAIIKKLAEAGFKRVANIVGHTMQFHPHGDASIKDALVQLGQKNLLIDCQGNWGNILTGTMPAALAYIGTARTTANGTAFQCSPLKYASKSS